jgi:hypothetical protein
MNNRYILIIITTLLLGTLLTSCDSQTQQRTTTHQQEEDTNPPVAIFAEYLATMPYTERAAGGTLKINGQAIQQIRQEFMYVQNDTTKVLTFFDKSATNLVKRRYIISPAGTFYCENDRYAQTNFCKYSNESIRYIETFANFTTTNNKEEIALQPNCYKYTNPSYSGLDPYLMYIALENISIDFVQCIDEKTGLIINATAQMQSENLGRQVNNTLTATRVGIVTTDNVNEYMGLFSLVNDSN